MPFLFVCVKPGLLALPTIRVAFLNFYLIRYFGRMHDFVLASIANSTILHNIPCFHRFKSVSVPQGTIFGLDVDPTNKYMVTAGQVSTVTEHFTMVRARHNGAVTSHSGALTTR